MAVAGSTVTKTAFHDVVILVLAREIVVEPGIATASETGVVNLAVLDVCRRVLCRRVGVPLTVVAALIFVTVVAGPNDSAVRDSVVGDSVVGKVSSAAVVDVTAPRRTLVLCAGRVDEIRVVVSGTTLLVGWLDFVGADVSTLLVQVAGTVEERFCSNGL